MRARMAAMLAAAGMSIFMHATDRDRYVTGAAYGAGSGKTTGGLADHSLPVMRPDGRMESTSGRCYVWTRSGRLVLARCR